MKFSVPSYVIPGTWLENLNWLLANTDQRRVELLFFLYDDETIELLHPEKQAILEMAKEFLFTLHLPDKLTMRSIELVDTFYSVSEGFIVHPPREEADLPEFLSIIEKLFSIYGSDKFYLENTRLEIFSHADRIISERIAPMNICADIGHLVLEGRSVSGFLDGYGERIRELHVHGLKDGKDHKEILGKESWIQENASFLKSFDGIIEVEVFSWAEAEKSMKALYKSLTGNKT